VSGRALEKRPASISSATSTGGGSFRPASGERVSQHLAGSRSCRYSTLAGRARPHSDLRRKARTKRFLRCFPYSLKGLEDTRTRGALGSGARAGPSLHDDPAERCHLRGTCFRTKYFEGRSTPVDARPAATGDSGDTAREGDHVRPSRNGGGIPGCGAPHGLGAARGEGAALASRGGRRRPNRPAGGRRGRATTPPHARRRQVPGGSSPDGRLQLDSQVTRGSGRPRNPSASTFQREYAREPKLGSQLRRAR
jgi:hypothetical protein